MTAIDPAADRLRRAAWMRSLVRELVMTKLTLDQQRTHDVEGIVAELLTWEDTRDWEFTGNEWAQFIERHEFDEHGMTEMGWVAAQARQRTGWVALIRRPNGELQQLSLKQGAPDQTAESVEQTLRDFVQFPEGTVISILPLVG